ncbi:MAG: hypothetical protein OEX99_03795 [Candidatus Bathyarchaeota archaeon]|nr:hypothetical protein [Candidatus Bathyarchaeota archaeon]
MMFPRMIEVRQSFQAPRIEDYVSAIRDELRKKGLYNKVKAGMSIAITAGSRGIAHYPEILATVVEEVKRLEGNLS